MYNLCIQIHTLLPVGKSPWYSKGHTVNILDTHLYSQPRFPRADSRKCDSYAHWDSAQPHDSEIHKYLKFRLYTVTDTFYSDTRKLTNIFNTNSIMSNKHAIVKSVQRGIQKK